MITILNKFHQLLQNNCQNQQQNLNNHKIRSRKEINYFTKVIFKHKYIGSDNYITKHFVILAIFIHIF